VIDPTLRCVSTAWPSREFWCDSVGDSFLNSFDGLEGCNIVTWKGDERERQVQKRASLLQHKVLKIFKEYVEYSYMLTLKQCSVLYLIRWTNWWSLNDCVTNTTRHSTQSTGLLFLYWIELELILYIITDEPLTMTSNGDTTHSHQTSYCTKWSPTSPTLWSWPATPQGCGQRVHKPSP